MAVKEEGGEAILPKPDDEFVGFLKSIDNASKSLWQLILSFLQGRWGFPPPPNPQTPTNF